MDLGSLISQSATRIKKNWILLVPPILNQVVIPLLLLALAAFTLFPFAMALGATGDDRGLIWVIAGGILLFGIAGFLIENFLTAGWAYMNKRVVIDGETRWADLWVGARKYFLPILGGRLLIGVMVVIPIAAGTAAIAASIATLNIGPLTPPGELAPVTIAGLIAPLIMQLIGILVIVGLIELVLYIFLVPWMQALVMDDLGIVRSIRSSFTFVRKNFATMIGYIVISTVTWIVAAWLASLLWPSFSYSELTRPAVYLNGARLLGVLLGATNVIHSVMSALLSAFFTLLLFIIYADRTRTPLGQSSAVQVTTAAPVTLGPARLRRAPRGMKYCLNCGVMLVSLAVFCPQCGARQPPLAPS
jgi:hypothetical protein